MARTKLILDGHSADEKVDLKQAKLRLKVMKGLEKHAPMNYTHRVCLIEASICEVEGKFSETERLFTKGIKLAEKEGYANDVAVGLEEFGKILVET